MEVFIAIQGRKRNGKDRQKEKTDVHQDDSL